MTAAMLALALALVVTAAAAPTRSTFNEADMPIHLVDEVTRCGAAKVSVQRSPGPFPSISSHVLDGYQRGAPHFHKPRNPLCQRHPPGRDTPL
jgi:hypothetical protein